MTNDKRERTLGDIPRGKTDAKIETNPLRSSHKKQGRQRIEQLSLPPGALIAFRSSGGLKFRSRETIVFPDGRLIRSGTDLPKDMATPRRLEQGQIAELRLLLIQTAFHRLKTETGQQPPDSIAYEIVAQVDSNTHYVQVFDGKIPESLSPLIRYLTKLFL